MNHSNDREDAPPLAGLMDRYSLGVTVAQHKEWNADAPRDPVELEERLAEEYEEPRLDCGGDCGNCEACHERASYEV